MSCLPRNHGSRSLALLVPLALWLLAGPPAVAQQGKVFFAQGATGGGSHEIQSVDLDGSNAFGVLDGWAGSAGIAHHPVTCDIYYVGTGGANPTIDVIKSNGTGQQTILANPGFGFLPTGLALDHVNGRIYWISPRMNEVIGSCKLDGTDPQVVMLHTAATPVRADTINVDATGGRIYWYDSRTRAIRSTDLTGTLGITDLYVRPPWVRATELDLVNRHIYWTQSDNTMWRGGMNGVDIPVQVLTSPDPFTFGSLALDNTVDRIYWAIGTKLRWTSLSNPGGVSESTIATGNAMGPLEILDGPDVLVSTQPNRVSPGDTVKMRVCGGKPGVPSYLYLGWINGIPFLTLLASGNSDATGELGIQGTVPPGLSGAVMDFIGVTQDPLGRNTVTLPSSLLFL